MPDNITSYLQGQNLPQQAKADAWQAAQAGDQDTFNKSVGALNIPQNVKADLWQMKFGNQQTAAPSAATSVSPQQSAAAPRKTIGGWFDSNIMPGIQRFGEDVEHLTSLDELPGQEAVRAKYGNTGLDYKSTAPTLVGRIEDSIKQPFANLQDLQTYKNALNPNSTSTASQITQHVAGFAQGLTSPENLAIGATLGPGAKLIGSGAGAIAGAAGADAAAASARAIQIAHRAAAGYFGAQGLYQGAKSAKAAIEDKMNGQSAVGDTTDAVLNAAMGGLGARFAIKGEVAPNETAIPTTASAPVDQAPSAEPATPISTTPPNAAGTVDLIRQNTADVGLGPNGRAGILVGGEKGTGVKGLLPASTDNTLTYNGQDVPESNQPIAPMSPEAEAVSDAAEAKAQASTISPGDNSPLVRTVTSGGVKYPISIADPHDAAALQLITKKSTDAQQPFLDQLQQNFPDVSESDLRDHGQAVKAAIKDAVANAKPGEAIQLPSMSSRLSQGDSEGENGPSADADASIRGDLRPGDMAQPASEVSQTPEAEDLENKMRPQIGQVMRLSQLLQGDQTGEALERGLDETSNLDGPGLSTEERQIASAALGSPVRSAFTLEQVAQARELLGKQKSESPKISPLPSRLTADAIQRSDDSRVAATQALNDPNTDPAHAAKLQDMLSRQNEDGTPKRFLYEPKDQYQEPVALAADHPEAPFTDHAYGAEVPQISRKNLAAALGKTPRTMDMGLGDPALKAQIQELSKAAPAEVTSGGEGTVNENTNGMSYEQFKHSTDSALRGLKNDYYRGAVSARIGQTMADLRENLKAYKSVRDPQAQSKLVSDLRALPKSSFQHLPKEIQNLAKESGTDAAKAAESPRDEKPAAQTSPTEKAGSSSSPARSASASTAAKEIDKIKKAYPEKLENVRTLHQVAVEHFGHDTDGATRALGNALMLYRKGVENDDAFALNKAVKYIRRQTPEDGTGSIMYSGIDPTEGIKSAKSIYRLINPKLSDSDIAGVSTDALHNILTRYEKMTPMERSSYTERIWGNDLDRLANDSDPKQGLEDRLSALRNTLAPSKSALARLADVFVRNDPQREQFRSTVRSIRGESRVRELQFKNALSRFDRETAGWGAGEGTQFIDKMERGEDQGTPFKNELASALRDMLDTQREQITQMRPDVLKEYIANYFPHIWTNVGKARNVFGRVSGSLTGNESFLKQRDHDLFVHGLSNGLQPVSWNPVRLAVLRAEQMQQMVMKEKTLQAMDARGWRQMVKAGDPVPAGMVPLADRSNALAGVMAGQYYAPERVAKDFNNAFGPGGLQGKPLYDTVRRFNGLSAMLQLGFSAVHGFTIARQTIAGELTRAGMAMQAGRYGDAVKSGLWSAGFPALLVKNFHLGQELSRALADPQKHLDYADFVDNFKKANMNTGLDKLTATHFGDMLNSSWNVVKDQNFSTAQRLKNAPTAAYAALGRIVEKASAPMMEHIVPNMKMAGFYTASQDAIRDHQGTADELDQKIQKIADNYDDHMGEIATDNLWWGKTTRDLANILFLAKGWTYGNARMYLGGTQDLIKTLHDAKNGKGFNLSHRTMYAAGSLVALMYTNALYQSILPNSPDVKGLDYLYPRDGSKDANGNYNRINPLAPEFDPISYYHDFTSTLTHKASPVIATALELEQNKDYYGHEITDPSDNMAERIGKRAEYAFKKNATPISLSDYQADSQRDSGNQSFFQKQVLGFHPSPKWVGQTPAENLASTYYKEQLSDAPMDDDQFEKMQTAVQARTDYANGKLSVQGVADLVNQGKLPAKFLDTLFATAKQTPLQRQAERITMPQAMKVWKVATTGERKQMESVLLNRLNGLPAGQAEQYVNILNQQ